MPPVGGMAEALNRLLATPNVAAFETEVFNTSSGDPSAPTGPKTLSFRRVRRRLTLVLRLGLAVLRRPPAIVHFHFGSESFFNQISDVMLMYTAVLRRASIILHLHIDPAEASIPGRRPITRRIFQVLTRGVSVVLVLTPSHLTTVQTLARDVVVLPNTCDETLLRIPPRQGTGPMRCLFLGRLTEAKGIFDLLAVAHLLRERQARIVFDVAGLSTSAEEQMLLERTVTRDSLDNVRFYGSVYGEIKQMLIAAADVMFVPSHFESFGISAVEGMAAGIPVVASAVGGLITVVRDGLTGFLVPVGDSQAMASRLEQLEASPETRIMMGEEGRRRFHSEYSADVVGRTAAKIYRELLDRKSS